MLVEIEKDRQFWRFFLFENWKHQFIEKIRWSKRRVHKVEQVFERDFFYISKNKILVHLDFLYPNRKTIKRHLRAALDLKAKSLLCLYFVHFFFL